MTDAVVHTISVDKVNAASYAVGPGSLYSKQALANVTIDYVASVHVKEVSSRHQTSAKSPPISLTRAPFFKMLEHVNKHTKSIPRSDVN